MVDDSNLQMALSDGSGVGDGGSNVKPVNERGYLANFSDNGDVDGKKTVATQKARASPYPRSGFGQRRPDFQVLQTIVWICCLP